MRGNKIYSSAGPGTVGDAGADYQLFHREFAGFLFRTGKTTLVRKIAADLELHVVTLDYERFRRFANSNPDGFMRGLDRVVIDEIQRAPDLILALKKGRGRKHPPGA